MNSQTGIKGGNMEKILWEKEVETMGQLKVLVNGLADALPVGDVFKDPILVRAVEDKATKDVFIEIK